jgi:hypothetical protein
MLYKSTLLVHPNPGGQRGEGKEAALFGVNFLDFSLDEGWTSNAEKFPGGFLMWIQIHLELSRLSSVSNLLFQTRQSAP